MNEENDWVFFCLHYCQIKIVVNLFDRFPVLCSLAV